MTQTMSPEMTRELGEQYLARLRRWVRRSNRWFALCAEYSAGTGAPPSVRLMPSKASKHHAYSDAGQAARLLGLEVPHTYAALCEMVGEPDARPEGLR